MTTLRTYAMTNEELAETINQSFGGLADQMVMDGFIANREQLTERYFATIVEKGTLVKMFQKFFSPTDEKGSAKIVVLRVDNRDNRKPAETPAAETKTEVTA